MVAKTDVAAKNNTAVGQALDFSQDAGAGLEGVDKNSLAIPFISLLQPLSPQCQEVSDGGVEGAKAGMFINSITNELYKTVLVMPVAFQRAFLRWAPNRGGYRGQYPGSDVDAGKVPNVINVNGKLLIDVPEGTKDVLDAEGRPKFDFLSDTRNHFVLAKTNSGQWVPALISLGSTQIKKSKRWLSLISGIELKDANGNPFTPSSFSHIYEIGSVKEENDKGKWHGVTIQLVEPVTDGAAYAKAKKFNADVVAGGVEVAPPMEESVAGSDSEKF